MADEETEFFAVPRTKDEAQVILRAAMAARPASLRIVHERIRRSSIQRPSAG